ncbi:hypothetical protein CLOP_g2327 [Closterium sp. NIES-67]|nr:hypothetical protein CLOP_g2327 [Closterium sp. NIES-67]
MENQLRENIDFEGTPIRLLWRSKRRTRPVGSEGEGTGEAGTGGRSGGERGKGVESGGEKGRGRGGEAEEEGEVGEEGEGVEVRVGGPHLVEGMRKV